MAKNIGHTNVIRDYSGGVARYRYDQTPLQKELRDLSNPRNREAIAKLKSQLIDEVEDQRAQRRSVFRQPTDPHKNNPVLTGKLLKAKKADEKQTNNNIERIIARLASFGVKTNRDKAGNVSFSPMNEGGNIAMAYDVTRLKQMKLETFQESAAGSITTEASDYLLKYFDIMIEAAKAGDVNELVSDYVAACKDGNAEKKEELKEKIQKVSDCKAAKAELESLKETLSDEEKKFVEDLDKEICGNCDNNEDAPTEESTSAGTDCGASPETQKVADNTVAKANDIGKKAESAASKAGKDNKGAFEELLSAAAESVGISDIGRNAILDYVVESVSSGKMDADDATVITQLMTLG